jgi:hypothetical protein
MVVMVEKGTTPPSLVVALTEPRTQHQSAFGHLDRKQAQRQASPMLAGSPERPTFNGALSFLDAEQPPPTAPE